MRFVTGDVAPADARPRSFKDAMGEMRRVLRPGGTLYLTVPFGQYENMGWRQQFDAAMLSEAIAAFDPAKLKFAFYRYSADGLQLTNMQHCGDCRYVGWISEAWSSGSWPHPFPLNRIERRPRAVACAMLE